MHKDTHHDPIHEENKAHGKILVLRPQSGISGDMLLTGLAQIAHKSNTDLMNYVEDLQLDVACSLAVDQKQINGINGFHLHLHLPHEHEHRNLDNVFSIIDKSKLTDSAKEYAKNAFELLAEAEGKVHNLPKNQVHFHEVGALDSIIDTCLCAALFDAIKPDQFICGPLPIADGSIECAHGLISAPAPAVLHLLKNVKITSTLGEGEMVTPTAISLLKAFGAEFGPWPSMCMTEHVIVYGNRLIPHIPNGALFALGFGD